MKPALDHAKLRIRIQAHARLSKMIAQADQLCSVNGGTDELRHKAAIVRGYAELFEHYEDGKFPWSYVHKKVRAMVGLALKVYPKPPEQKAA